MVFNLDAFYFPSYVFFHLFEFPKNNERVDKENRSKCEETYRNSRPEMFCEKGVLRNFAKFIIKYQCQSLLFNKVAGPRPTTLLKKRLWHRCFLVNFAKFLRTHFLEEHLWWLLLNLVPFH